LAAAAAIDKQSALHLGERPKQRPARHFLLGQEGGEFGAAEHDDIDPGNVIGHQQSGRSRAISPRGRTRTRRRRHMMRQNSNGMAARAEGRKRMDNR